MNKLLHAIADGAREGGFFTVIILAFLLAGLGERLTVVLSGRHKLAAKSAELKSVRRENDRLHDHLATWTNQRLLVDSAQSGDSGRLLEQANVALTERAQLLGLVDRVQATDAVYPQLPRELRDDIDATIEQLRRPERVRFSIDE